MNYQQKLNKIKEVKGLFNPSYPEGTIKITEKESLEHATVKLQVCHWLKSNNYSVWTEVNLKGFWCKGRVDILAIHKSGISYIIKVIHSESDKSLASKQETYPMDIIQVNCNEFDYQEFKL